ncbi:discoidin domain-containing protein [Actinopolymorpha alba]|uniref:discoidin domain-containing protein n=1 Tax=Actinopolymorpha alba TaxID=533267 RepID=UPI00039B70AE|nr:discoidin domain-containing protein [Actinopolymorpha alba]
MAVSARFFAAMTVTMTLFLWLLPAGTGQPAYAARPGPTVSVATDPTQLGIQTGQCKGATFVVKLTNTGDKDLYADATLTAPSELQLQRTVISTYLPAGYTRDVAIPVTSPLGTPEGVYQVTIVSGRSEAVLPVTVTPSAPDPNGNLALSVSKASASSTHQRFRVCGAVDGDRDSNHWSTSTGWNDASSRVWPDWFQLQWDTPQTVGRVDLYTLNTARNPASTYGLKDWDVQVLSGGEWQTVASVRGNTQGLVSTTFAPVATTAVRVVTLAGNGANDYSRIIELEAYAS